MDKTTQPIDNELKILHGIPVSMQYDGSESLAQWQKKARKKLSELIGLQYYHPVDDETEIEYRTENDEFTETKFYFYSEANYSVPCILRVPKNVKNPALMICLQGHGTGMHISLGVAKYENDRNKIDNGDRDFAVQCIKRGMCALAIDQRNFGERGGNPRPVCHAPSMVALLTGRSTIAGRVWDIMRAIDVVKKHFGGEFDPERIFCMGNSGGGTATLYASALDERIKGAIPSCAFCTFEDSIGRQNHCECNYIPGIRNYFDMAEIAGMIAPRPLVIVSGKEDGIFPSGAAENEFGRVKNFYYKASAKPDNCVHVIGEEGHRFYADKAWKAFEELDYE